MRSRCSGEIAGTMSTSSPSAGSATFIASTRPWRRAEHVVVDRSLTRMREDAVQSWPEFQ